MQLQEFIDHVNEVKELSIEEHREDHGALLIRNDKTAIQYTVLYEAIEKHDWETLVSVLLGKREPQVLTHMTRICGYFSNTSNWNRSKLGELRARHQGNYSFDGYNDNAGTPYHAPKNSRAVTVVDTSARTPHAVEQGAE